MPELCAHCSQGRWIVRMVLFTCPPQEGRIVQEMIAEMPAKEDEAGP